MNWKQWNKWLSKFLKQYKADEIKRAKEAKEPKPVFYLKVICNWGFTCKTRKDKGSTWYNNYTPRSFVSWSLAEAIEYFNYHFPNQPIEIDLIADSGYGYNVWRSERAQVLYEGGSLEEAEFSEVEKVEIQPSLFGGE